RQSFQKIPACVCQGGTVVDCAAVARPTVSRVPEMTGSADTRCHLVRKGDATRRAMSAYKLILSVLRDRHSIAHRRSRPEKDREFAKRRACCPAALLARCRVRESH